MNARESVREWEACNNYSVTKHVNRYAFLSPAPDSGLRGKLDMWGHVSEVMSSLACNILLVGCAMEWPPLLHNTSSA